MFCDRLPAWFWSNQGYKLCLSLWLHDGKSGLRLNDGIILNQNKGYHWHTYQVVFGQAYRGLTGGFLLLRNFSVAISVSPHVYFILVLIFDFYVSKIYESSTQTEKLIV